MRWMRIVAAFLFSTATMCAQQIPAGTALGVMLTSTVDASKSKPDQEIRARVMQDVPLPLGSRIGFGSQVVGHIVEASAASESADSRLAIRFDRIESKGQDFPITAAVRAIASTIEVKDAQLPTRSPERSETVSNWTTVQVGGDIVYRGGGHVMHGDTIVGEPEYRGVLARLTSSPGSSCPGDDNSRPQALWVFSSSACGTYGLNDLKIADAGNTNVLGQTTLQSKRDIRIYAGTGLLLIVLPTTR